MNYVFDLVPPALIALYCALAVRHRWEPRGPILAAFGLLLLSAVTWPLRGLSDRLAFCAFYFLLAGAALLLADSIRRRRHRE